MNGIGHRRVRRRRGAGRRLRHAARGAALCGLLLAAAGCREPPRETPPSVGIEGATSFTWDGPPLFVKRQDPSSDVFVWIARTRGDGGARTYDLRYIGMVAGRHDLSQHLVLLDGSRPGGLRPIPVEVRQVLPEGYRGYLTPARPGRVKLRSWYREFLVAATVAWLLLFFPIWRYGRVKRELPVPPPAPPTLADRLRPLVIQAADGTLTIAGKARLEGLLMSYWCRKLGLDPGALAASIAALKRHPVAGELFRALETWLHRPPGAGTVGVPRLLAPYRDARDPEPEARPA